MRVPNGRRDAGSPRLYTGWDEVLFDASRPVILNGIENIVTRANLDRPRRVPDAGADPGRSPAFGPPSRSNALAFLGVMLDAVYQSAEAGRLAAAGDGR
jgi:hypothetical protein